MYKVILAIISALAILTIPANSQAPASSGGEVATKESPSVSSGSEDQQVRSSQTLKEIPQELRDGSGLTLTMPLAVSSIHTNYIGDEVTYAWRDLNGGEIHSYGLKNDQFIHQAGDTWFIYGIFGAIEATKYDWNVKYKNWGGRHNGIDLAMAPETPILAASGGEVIFAGRRAGNTVVVKIDNFQITYSHLQSIAVRVGESTKPGQLIGLSGASGTVNPHLHFQIDEYRADGTRWGINPMKYLPQLQRAIMPDVPTNKYIDGSHVDFDSLAPGFRW